MYFLFFFFEIIKRRLLLKICLVLETQVYGISPRSYRILPAYQLPGRAVNDIRCFCRLKYTIVQS